MWNQQKKKEWAQCFFTIGIWNQWLVVESVKSITSFYCPAVPELYGSLKCAFWLLTWKFCLLDDVLLVNSVLCMIADHDLVFGRCGNKEPHSSGILLCRVVVVGYEKLTNPRRQYCVCSWHKHGHTRRRKWGVHLQLQDEREGKRQEYRREHELRMRAQKTNKSGHEYQCKRTMEYTTA